MAARFREPSVEVAPASCGLRLRCLLENRSGERWQAGKSFAIGWQVIDPETGVFISEGEWTSLAAGVEPGGAAALEIPVELPPEHGRYHVYISRVDEESGWDYARGEPFLLIDAEVSGGGARVIDTGVTTTARLRAKRLLALVPWLFVAPVLAIARNRALIRSMVRRDIMARYRGSMGDVLWTILNPLLLMSTYFFVFGVVLNARFGADQSRTGFALYFLAGMLPWLAFSEAAGRSSVVILEHRNFVKKLVFPVETLPVNHVVSGLVTEGFALLVFLAALWVARGVLHPTLFWLPVLLIPQLLFTLGLAWFLAATGVFFRDLGQIIGFVLTLWFFITPICYPDSALPAYALPVLGKNPVYTLVRGYRAVLLEGRAPDWQSLWKLWLLAIGVCLGGHAWFHKFRRLFPDVL